MRLTKSNMNKLFFITLIAVLASVAVYFKPESKENDFVPGSALVQGLDVESIGEIIIRGKKAVVHVVDKDGVFVVQEKNDYPAANADINNLLIDLLDINCALEITDADLGGLGLNEEKPANGSLLINDKSGKEILSLLIGNNSHKGSAVKYGETVYITDRKVVFSAHSMSYINQVVSVFKPAEIKKVLFTRGGESIKSVRSEKGFILFDFADENTTLDNKKFSLLQDALARITIEDVMKVPSEGVEIAFSYRVELENEAVYIYDFTTQKNLSGKADLLLQIKSLTPDLPELTTGGTLNKEEAKLLEVVAMSKDFNSIHAGWLYRIGSFEAQNLDIKLTDLLKKKEKKLTK